MPPQKSIGVFDSGLGGLTILRSIRKKLPQYNYLYLGDTARAPYGNRSRETVYEFTVQAIDFLFKNGAELIILACNTASSEALRKIQKKYLPLHHPNKRVIGVLVPATEETVIRTKNNRVGVIATENTVRSGAFKKEIAKLDSSIKVFQNACPLLVPLIESGEIHSPLTDLALQKYLKPLKEKNIDTLILGCTHYSILKKQVQKNIGHHVTIISEDEMVPKKLETYLFNHPEIERKIGTQGQIQFYSTDLTDKFQTLASLFFKKRITVQKAVLR